MAAQRPIMARWSSALPSGAGLASQDLFVRADQFARGSRQSQGGLLGRMVSAVTDTYFGPIALSWFSTPGLAAPTRKASTLLYRETAVSPSRVRSLRVTWGMPFLVTYSIGASSGKWISGVAVIAVRGSDGDRLLERIGTVHARRCLGRDRQRERRRHGRRRHVHRHAGARGAERIEVRIRTSVRRRRRRCGRRGIRCRLGFNAPGAAEAVRTAPRPDVATTALFCSFQIGAAHARAVSRASGSTAGNVSIASGKSAVRVPGIANTGRLCGMKERPRWTDERTTAARAP